MKSVFGYFGKAEEHGGRFYTLCEEGVAELLPEKHSKQKNDNSADFNCYLTIIPRAPKGSESIAHEAEGRMGYWLRGHEGERNNCFSKIQLVGQKYWDKTTLASLS